MPCYRKRSPKLRFQFVPAQRQSTRGGLPALEVLAQPFDLWNQVRRWPGLDPRPRTSHSYSPELIVAQILYCFCSGGASLADAERLNDEPRVRQLARVHKFADQTQLGPWLRAPSDESIAAVWKLIAEFIGWVIARADAARWTYAGRAEGFFDDTPIAGFGPTFEGAKINDNGDLARSWQTFWFGPFLLAGERGSPGDVRAAWSPGLKTYRKFGQDRACDFLADSGSSRATQLQAIDAAGFTHGRVSDNQWTSVPERTAAALPENAWRVAEPTRWRDGTEVTEPHAGIRHPPAESDFPFPLAVARWKKADDWFWRYSFVAHEGRGRDAGAVLARHRLKGGKQPMFKEVLRGLDLHHPPCESLTANRMFYALGARADNLMKAVQRLCRPDECQSWTVATLLRQLVRRPSTLGRPARRLVARVEVALNWLGWWQAWEARWWTGAGASAGTASG